MSASIQGRPTLRARTRAQQTGRFQAEAVVPSATLFGTARLQPAVTQVAAASPLSPSSLHILTSDIDRASFLRNNAAAHCVFSLSGAALCKPRRRLRRCENASRQSISSFCERRQRRLPNRWRATGSALALCVYEKLNVAPNEVVACSLTELWRAAPSGFCHAGNCFFATVFCVVVFLNKQSTLVMSSTKTS